MSSQTSCIPCLHFTAKRTAYSGSKAAKADEALISPIARRSAPGLYGLDLWHPRRGWGTGRLRTLADASGVHGAPGGCGAPLHVEQARAAANGYTVELGDARSLHEPDASADAVLL